MAHDPPEYEFDYELTPAELREGMLSPGVTMPLDQYTMKRLRRARLLNIVLLIVGVSLVALFLIRATGGPRQGRFVLFAVGVMLAYIHGSQVVRLMWIRHAARKVNIGIVDAQLRSGLGAAFTGHWRLRITDYGIEVDREHFSSSHAWVAIGGFTITTNVLAFFTPAGMLFALPRREFRLPGEEQAFLQFARDRLEAAHGPLKST